jgi:hypothetical protein
MARKTGRYFGVVYQIMIAEGIGSCANGAARRKNAAKWTAIRISEFAIFADIAKN